jgi:hypothetical protein
MFRLSLSSRAIVLLVGVHLVAIAALVAHAQRPIPARHEGWAGPESVKQAAPWAAQQPKFELVHPITGEPVWQDNATARVCQWEDVIAANGGTMPVNIRQTVGDCSSRGPAHGLERHLAANSPRGPPTYRRIAPHWLYGAGREWTGKGIFRGGDGCNVAYIAKAAHDFGILFQDDPGVPPYEGSTIRKWGNSGPPEALKAIAAERRVKTVSLLKTVNDVRDAVCNRYGVATGGSWGTADNKSGFRQQDGRWVARRNDRWAHVVCIDGYDGSVPGKQYFHIQNSWGETFHPEPVDLSPKGGFWVEAADVLYMVNDGDTWAFSDVDGFAARLDVSPLRPKPRPAPGEPAKTLLAP